MKYFFAFLLFVSANQLFAQSTIGDVRYSILKPEIFTDMNPDWVLMDGGKSRQSDSLFKISKLHLQYHVDTLPDARGVFLRGMNMMRDVSQGDPSGDSDVGRYQPDLVGSHKHATSALVGFAGGWAAVNFSQGGPGNPIAANTTAHTPITIVANAGEETRPRNITVYTYIKIN